jgi:CRISPR type III-B/RAMP module RAMP protein Cmr6
VGGLTRIRALRATSRALIEKPEILRQVSPGFYFQRCLPIWDSNLGGIIKEGKASAVAPLDRHGEPNGQRVLGDPGLYRALAQRSVHAYNMLRECLEGVELRLRNLSPFVTGIGQPHPLENGFAFLRPYGVPYLSGSGVKGAVRAACNQAWDQAVDRAECRRRLLHYFGSEDKDTSLSEQNPHRRGALVFLDLFPEVESWEDAFRLDIVNPHYGSYYQGKEVPADWHAPVPSFFLTLRAGLSWHLRVLYAPCEPHSRRADWPIEVKPGLAAALTIEGLGAKKTWGYGLFRIQGVAPDVRPWREMAERDQVVPGEPLQRLQDEQKPEAIEPPMVPQRSAQAASVEGTVRTLKAHEVSGRLQAIVAEIRRCPAEERTALFESLRSKVQELIKRKRDVQGLLGPYPEMGGGAGS